MHQSPVHPEPLPTAHPERRAPNLSALALLLLLASACTTVPVRSDVAWPPPPETARVRFVNSIRQTADLGPSRTSELLRVVFGGDRDVTLGRPMGLALSPDGQRLYIADAGRGAVLVADFETKSLRELAGGDVVGSPFGIATDEKEAIYVADSVGRRVLVLSRLGVVMRVIGQKAGLLRPSGVAVDSKRGLLYVSDPASLKAEDHRVLVFTLDGDLVRVLGKGKGDGPGQFYFPVYLTLDAEGRLYVGDTMNFRLQVFGPDGSYLKSFGEHGDGPGMFARIKGLAFDGFKNLYVVEGEHAVVQLFNKDFDPLMFFGGIAPKLEFLELPSAIAIDQASGRIYVANEVNARVNVYELVNTKAEDSLPRAEASPATNGD